MGICIDLENNAGRFYLEEIEDKIIIEVRYSAPIDETFGDSWGGHYGCVVQGDRIISEELPKSTNHIKLLSIINNIILKLEHPRQEVLKNVYSYKVVGANQINEYFKEVIRSKP